MTAPADACLHKFVEDLDSADNAVAIWPTTIYRCANCGFYTNDGHYVSGWEAALAAVRARDRYTLDYDSVLWWLDEQGDAYNRAIKHLPPYTQLVALPVEEANSDTQS